MIIIGIGAIVIVVLLTGLFAYAATMPETFQVQRSATIKAPPEKIFPLINNLRNFNTWNPFLKKDAATKLTYSGPDSGKGAAQAWDGNGQVGKGRFEIMDVSPPSKVTMELDMIKPIAGRNLVEFTLKPEADATNVTWAMSGRSPYVAKLMGVFFSMDKMCGGEFEKGLADLKVIAEKS